MRPREKYFDYVADARLDRSEPIERDEQAQAEIASDLSEALDDTVHDHTERRAPLKRSSRIVIRVGFRWFKLNERAAHSLSQSTTTRMNRVRQAFEPSIRRAFHLYWRWARGVTLGVRGLVIDKDQRIFLVTHTYVPGWQLPGGGVEPGETMAEALARELVEEGNIEILEPPVLHGLFFNSRVSQRDHVALFIVRSFRQQRAGP